MASLYTYQDLTPGQFRLATLLPANDPKAVIQVTLEECLLDDTAPPYEALSYTWESPADSMDGKSLDGEKSIIMVGDQVVEKIPPNLVWALRQFRKDAAGQSIIFWADSICIDQKSDTEKPQQVKMMANIYKQAANVRIWLGPASTHTKLGFEHLRYAMTEEIVETLESIQPDSAEELSGLYSGIEAWLALGTIFRKNYWRRRWITQEFVVAQSRTIYCGEFRVGPLTELKQDIGRVVYYANKCQGVTSRYGHTFDQVDGREQNVMGVIHFECSTILEALDPLVRALPTDGWDNASTNEWNAIELEFFLRSDCTKDIDRVYGVLGLLPSGLAGRMPPPNYKTGEVRKVYEKFTYEFMSLTRSFNLMYLAQGPSNELPSWVPDLRRNARHIPQFLSQDWQASDESSAQPPFLTGVSSFYKAAASSELSIDSTTPGILTIRSFPIDRIAGVIGLPAKINPPIILKDWVELLISIHKPGISPHQPPSLNDLVQAMSLDMTPETQVLGSTFRRCNVQDLERYPLAWLCDINKLPEGVTEAEIRAKGNWLMQVAMSSFFFVTEQGRIGRSSREVLVGDQIFIVAGASMPMCLRKSVDEDTYAFVGSAYVRGIMDGEGLPAADSGNVNEVFQNVHLV